MNELLIYQQEYKVNEWLDKFESIVIGGQMRYLASDLLKEGLSISDIEEAIHGAIKICRSSGMEVRKHFMPVYTQISGYAIRDCKTSRLGLALILLNANPDRAVVGKWQRKVLQKYFE